MAFSSALKSRSIAGNVIMECYTVSFASVTSGDVSTGISDIHSAQFQNEVSEGQGILVRSGQKVSLSGVTSNDTGTLLVVGV